MSKRVDRSDQILDAAMRLADAGGLEGLTVRALCDEVGVTAPVIYRHFEDKDAILHALARRMLGTSALSSPGTHDSVADWLLRTFVRMRQEMDLHPQLIALFTRTQVMLEQALRVSEVVLETLERSDLDPTQRGACFHTLMAFTVGSAGMARSTEERTEAMLQTIARYPRVLRAGPALDARDTAVFERGLRAVLRGFGFEPSG